MDRAVRIDPDSRDSGVVFNVQRFSTRDGPGIRTTVFFKGCPLHCPWCHNPESIGGEPEMAVIESRCIACLECVAGDPTTKKVVAGTVVGTRTAGPLAHDLTVCPTGAREVVGRWWTVAEVQKSILRDRLFYDGSGGGVTFSGGEPLAQHRFLEQCLCATRAEGIHTAVDTSGSGSAEILLTIARSTDLFLYDLKPLGPGLHQRLVGVPFEQVVANLEALAEAHACIWLRIPVVPGFTDDSHRLEEIRRLATRLSAVRRVCLLPYHPTGMGKYERVGRRYDREAFETPMEERLRSIAREFEAAGLDVTVGG